MKRMKTRNVGIVSGDPFAMLFAYFKDGDSTLVKGSLSLIKEHMKDARYIGQLVVYRSKGRDNGWISSDFLIRRSLRGYVIYLPQHYHTELLIRHIPHKWIPEYDDMLNKLDVLRSLNMTNEGIFNPF